MATKAEIWTAASRPATAMNGAPGSLRVRRPRKTIASDTAAVTAASATRGGEVPVAGGLQRLVPGVRRDVEQVGEPVTQQQPGGGHAEDHPGAPRVPVVHGHDCRLGADITGKSSETGRGPWNRGTFGP